MVVVLMNTNFVVDTITLQAELVINQPIYFFFLGSSTWWMLGNTPPAAMVTPPSSLLSSSSLRTASCKCLGMILLRLLSRAAFPASSRISAHKYSSTAAMYTGAPLPRRGARRCWRMYLPIRPTGNCRPARADRVVDFEALARPEDPLPPFPLPFPGILTCRV